MKKILASLMLLTLTLGIVGAGSYAYFSDTETSNDNSFIAGQIDLEVGYTSTYNGDPDQSWGIIDSIDDELFFDFIDVKPGDYGQGTAQIRVTDNPSWLCSNITLTSSLENNRNDAEQADGDITVSGNWAGELDDAVEFFFWIDQDSNGIYDSAVDTAMAGPAPVLASSLDQTGAGNTFDLVDVTTNLFDPASVGTAFADSATQDIQVDWCFGDMTITDGVGITCDGSSTNNLSQSDSMNGNISFYAVQERHNDAFECSSWNPNVSN